MGRGSSIMYGKIQLASEGESVEKLIGQLDVIMKKWGYPEKKIEESDEKEIKAIDEEIMRASPAKDSVADLVKKELVPNEDEEESEEIENFPADDQV